MRVIKLVSAETVRSFYDAIHTGVAWNVIEMLTKIISKCRNHVLSSHRFFFSKKVFRSKNMVVVKRTKCTKTCVCLLMPRFLLVLVTWILMAYDIFLTLFNNNWLLSVLGFCIAFRWHNERIGTSSMWYEWVSFNWFFFVQMHISQFAMHNTCSALNKKNGNCEDEFFHPHFIN